MSFVFEDSPGYFINKAASLMRASLSRAIQAEYGEITVDYWVVLNRLWIRDGMIQSELAILTGKDNASITRILDGMHKKDLIFRQPDRNDRRAFRIHLTLKGRDLEGPLKSIAQRNTEKGLKNLTASDITTLKKILGKMMENYL